MLPDDVFSVILPYIDNPYAFSISCRHFNNLFRKYVQPTNVDVGYAIIERKPISSIIYCINKLKTIDQYVFNDAIEYGLYDVVKLILKKHDYIPRLQSLNVAAYYGHYKTLRLLIKYFKDDVDDILTTAIHSGHYRIVKLLLPYVQTSLKFDLRWLLKTQNYFIMFKILLPYYDFTVDIKPLIYAIESNNDKTVRIVLSYIKGMDLSSFITNAILTNNPKIFNMIASRSKEVNIKAGVLLSVHSGNYNILHHLLKRGYDLTFNNNEVLRLASRVGNRKILRLLLRDPNIVYKQLVQN